MTLAENGTTGTFNAVGPTTPGRWGDVLDACVAAAPVPARLEWVPAAWLDANGQGGEDGFPIWIPPTGESAGFHRWKNQRAVDAGLKFRPMSGVSAASARRPAVDWRRSRRRPAAPC